MREEFRRGLKTHVKRRKSGQKVYNELLRILSRHIIKEIRFNIENCGDIDSKEGYKEN